MACCLSHTSFVKEKIQCRVPLSDLDPGPRRAAAATDSLPSILLSRLVVPFNNLTGMGKVMNRKLKIVSLLGILALTLIMNVAVSTDVYARTVAVAIESDTPCTDQWAGCIAGGGSEAFCHGMWCGCMYSRYGYICEAQMN
jgi:hypothetical protein